MTKTYNHPGSYIIYFSCLHIKFTKTLYIITDYINYSKRENTGLDPIAFVNRLEEKLVSIETKVDYICYQLFWLANPANIMKRIIL